LAGPAQERKKKEKEKEKEKEISSRIFDTHFSVLSWPLEEPSNSGQLVQSSTGPIFTSIKEEQQIN
jgi:hypothetical protein